MIYTYFLKLNNTPWSDADERLLRLVSEQRAVKIVKQKRTDLKRLSLYSALLTCFALSDIFNVDPLSLEFESEEGKKPRLKNRAENIDFNFSHTTGAILLAICNDGCIGADIENIEARETPFNIMKRFFSEEERSYVNEGLHEQSLRFYECWTAKEAFLKKSGAGLSTSLRAVNTLDDSFSRRIITWHEGSYVCSVCADTPDHDSTLSRDMLNITRLDENELRARILLH